MRLPLSLTSLRDSGIIQSYLRHSTMTKQCTQCKSEVEDAAVVCVNCGSAVAEPARWDVAAASAAVQLHEPSNATGDGSAQQASSSRTFSLGRNFNQIGGWLFLVAAGLVIWPFMILRDVFSDLVILYGDRFQPALAARPGLAGLVMLEAVTNTVFLAAFVFLNVLFYKRKRNYPNAMTACFVAQFVWMFADHLMALHYHMNSDWMVVLRKLIVVVIWILYLAQSRRVQATFVNE